MRRIALLCLLAQLTACTVVVDAPSKKKPTLDVTSLDLLSTDGQTSDIGLEDGWQDETSPSSDTVASDASDVLVSDASVDAVGDAGVSEDAGVGELPGDAIGPEEDASGPPTTFTLETADDVLMQGPEGGTTGTLVLQQDSAAVFPLDMLFATKHVLALTPDTLMATKLPFSCLGNEAMANNYKDVTQIGPSGTLKLLPGHPVAEALNASPSVAEKGQAVVSQLEIQMPFLVPQDDVERVPGTLCYGFRAQGDWYINFDPNIAKLNLLEKLGTHSFKVSFPAKVDAIAIITGKPLGVDWIRWTAGSK